ncbi:ABC transporter permease [Herpetosiphon llansteffanensis]|uniref:ABC transporter permease n=1 Tax=Herpetosiphon llansteffanensis TaxID=2094568 RepID=UPI000D7C6C4B|nr:FtsX-like permease family protein [Herpetosiphon llansteffanensis]
MNILIRYTLKYLRLNKQRTAITIVGVMLSSALICGVFLLGRSVQQVMIDHAIFMAGNWHAQFKNVAVAQAQTISQHSAIETAMLSQPLGSATYGSHNEVRPYLYVTAYDQRSLQQQPIQLITGRLPETSNELLVSPVMVEDSGLDLQLGASITLSFGLRNIPDRAAMVQAWGGEEFVALQATETITPSYSKRYTVVGHIVPLPNETSMPAAFQAFTFFDSAQLTPSEHVDVAVLAHEPRSINATAPAIASSIGLNASQQISYNERLLPWMGGSGRSNYVQAFLVILSTLIGLIVLGSALVIYNAFGISIGQRKKQFGIFASVGATAAQIRRIVLIEAAIIAAIGIPLGLVAAIAGVGLLLQLTQGVVAQLIVDAEQGMPLIISPLIIGLSGLFAAATTVVSVWIPARRAAKITPIEAIRLHDDIQANQPLKWQTSPLVRRFFGFEGELALKALKRDRKRYRTSLISLMISIILFIGFNSLMLYTTTTRTMASQATGFDLIVDLDYRQSHANDFAAQVGQLPAIQRVAYRRCTYEEYITSRSGITDQAHQAIQELNPAKAMANDRYQFVLQVCAVGQSEFNHYLKQLDLDPKQYLDPAQPQGILINHYKHRQNGKLYDFDLFTLRPGDPIAIFAADQSTPSLTWTVGAVTEQAPLSMIGMGPAMVADLIVSDAVFDGLHDRLLQFGPINPGAMYIESNDPNKAVESLRQLYKSTVGGNFSYYSAAEANRSQELQNLMTRLFFYGFLSLITLIGVINMLNTLDTSIKLRRREIAMLKSVGLTPAGFRRMLRYESLFYGLTALLYGLPLAIALSVFLYYQFGMVGSFGFTLPWGAIGVCCVAILGLVYATMQRAGAQLRNDNIIETIKTEYS